MEQTLRTVDIVRRGYGTRYSSLPVDELDHNTLMIDCQGTYMRPDLYDLRVGDRVRWMSNGRYLEGNISHVERSNLQVRATLVEVELMAVEYSPY